MRSILIVIMTILMNYSEPHEIRSTLPCMHGNDIIEANKEIIEYEDRDVLKDIRTKFVPPFSHCFSVKHGRRETSDYKSQTNQQLLNGKKHKSYEGIYQTLHDEYINLPESMSEFSTFWKNKRDSQTIRIAQANMMMSFMDETVDPCQDFYQYACGNWRKQNPIPKEKHGYDTFEVLHENLNIVLKELLEGKISILHTQSIAPNFNNDATVKVKHLYQSCMNYEILEKRAEQPLINILDELGGWPILRPEWDPSQFDCILLMAQLRLYSNNILISEFVAPDFKNSDEYVIQIEPNNLGMPTKEYFLQPSNLKYLEAYRNYMVKISILLGASLDVAVEQVEEIIKFETKLAMILSTPEEHGNMSERYQKITVGELRQYIPQMDWYRYLSLVLARPIHYSEPIIVYAIEYIQDLVSLLGETQSKTIANYLLWRFVMNRINNLDDRFQDVKQRFDYILYGSEKSPPRWKKCVSQVNSHMGMALGSMFVSKYFDENSKNDTLQMTEEIMQSFRELLSQINWIDRETKELAAQKVDSMILKIGYPDFILVPELLNDKYKNVVIRPDQYFENILNILKFLSKVEHDRLGTPVNKTLWSSAPAVVNAYYNRNKNQIMFPAGILQPPFYHRFFPRCLNYGGIGIVIGHEITHGFDDKGRLFDKNGNLHRWWHDEAIESFNHHAQCLIDQYNQYTMEEVAMQVDGVNTQGENIADNGGIKQAFKAYQRWLEENGNSNENLPGMNATGYQLFFLNFAQIWCGTMRPDAIRNKIKTDVHSPGRFRVIGTLSNSEDFAHVYNCELGTPMNPIRKCSVW